MAYRVSNITPIDLQPRIAIGISLPFNGTIGFNSTYTTADQIKSNLINYLLTSKGERLFQPTFGANLRNFIFEQISELTISELEEALSSKLENNFNNLRVNNLTITPDYDNNQINIYFKYQIINTSITDNINIVVG